MSVDPKIPPTYAELLTLLRVKVKGEKPGIISNYNLYCVLKKMLEYFGSATVDLSAYYTKTEINTLLQNLLITITDLIDAIPKSNETFDTESYSSLLGEDKTIIIPELIGVTLLAAYRGVTPLKGTTMLPTGNSVQHDPLTGSVTFDTSLTDFEEILWFQYKAISAYIPPDPEPGTGPTLFSSVFSSEFQ